MFLWPLSMGMPYVDPHAGLPAAGAQAYFYQGGTTTPKPVFHTDDGAAPHTWPVVADADGRFPPIFIPYGSYGFRVTNKNDVAIGPNVSFVANPKPPEEGGGPGIIVTQNDILQTGDVLWNLRSGNRPGFVPMNGGTIGSGASGATLRASVDAKALFIYLHTHVSNDQAPVLGGRGANAEADFLANKTIVVPTMQGLIAGGVDDMGTAALNRLQVSTTITTTANSAAASVASAINLVIGMAIVSLNVPAGTTVSDINGSNITLSGPASAGGSGLPARFSMFGDAQRIGSIGGIAYRPQLLKELPKFTPTVTSGFGATVVTGGYYSIVSAAYPQIYNALAEQTFSYISYTPTLNQIGGGLASSLIQPTRLGFYFMKL